MPQAVYSGDRRKVSGAYCYLKGISDKIILNRQKFATTLTVSKPKRRGHAVFAMQKKVR